MAKEETGGVWRTIGGRRVFIRDGQSLADAMKESGKFKKLKDIEHQQRKINNELAGLTGKDKEQADEEYDAYEELKKKEKETEEPKFTQKQIEVKEGNPIEDFINKEGINAGGRLREVDSEAEEFFNQIKNANRTDEEAKTLLHFKYPNSNEDNLLDRYKQWSKTNEDYEYNLYKQARENPDSINPMTEWSTDWEDLDKKYKSRYEKEFKASMGEVDIPEDFTAQFNDYVNTRAKANASEGEKMRQFIQDNNIRTFGDEIRENSNKEMIDAIKNDKMNYEDDGLGGTYSIGEYGKGTYVQFQDRKSYQHDDIMKYPNATPKEKSYTWARVWQDGELVKDIEDSKYGARQKVIEYLENNNAASKKSNQNKDLEILNKHNLSGYDADFKRQMLGRMESDNKYYLGNGGRNERHLWAHDVDEHIGIMKALYNTLPEKERPDWLTMKDIENYEKQMKSSGDDYDGTREYLKKNTTMTNAQINEYIRNLKNKK